MLEPSSNKTLTFGLLSTLATLRVPSRTPMAMSRSGESSPAVPCAKPSSSMVLSIAQRAAIKKRLNLFVTGFRRMKEGYNRCRSCYGPGGFSGIHPNEPGSFEPPKWTLLRDQNELGVTRFRPVA